MVWVLVFSVSLLEWFNKWIMSILGVSRGPSPVSLGNQDTLPVAIALTESVNAYFKGADPTKCIVKITGDVTISFPSGIIKVFTSNPSPAVLCFRVKNISRLEQILPNSQLVFRFVCSALKNFEHWTFFLRNVFSVLSSYFLLMLLLCFRETAVLCPSP